MHITTEGLITHPAGFGITTASPCQRAACRIIDGLSLDELADDPDVQAFVGGPEAIARLGSERGVQPLEIVYLASIRSLKTITACAAALRMTQTVDVSRLGPGEVPRVSIVSLKLDTSSVAHRILTETVRQSDLLRGLVIGEPTSEVLTLKHPSGRAVEVACVAGARAGAGLVARWSAGVVFDEAPRMAGAEEGVVNLDDARRAVLGRLLPGAQALYIGSPWAPFGPVYDLVSERWAQPTDGLVVLRGTGPMLNPVWWTPERCAGLEQQDPIAYRTDVLGEFADPEASLFPSELLERCTRTGPTELERNPNQFYVAAMDPATRNNSWTLVVATCSGVVGSTRRHAIVLARQWTGSRGAPLSPEATLREIASVCAHYGVRRVRTDQWSADALADIARRVGLSLDFENVTATRKVELFEGLRVRLEAGELELPPVPLVREDLSRVRKRLTQNGLSIVLPRTADGRHADYAPALALAMSEPIPAPRTPKTIPDQQTIWRERAIAEGRRRQRREKPKDLIERLARRP